MLVQILVGSVLIVATVLVHAVGMSVALRWLLVSHARELHNAAFLIRSLVVAVMVLIMIGAVFIEAGLWAQMYVVLGAISDFEEALYFSLVTYSTLGYGDVVLERPWRLLSSIEAANGLIIFAWTTALIIAALRRFSRLVRRLKAVE